MDFAAFRSRFEELDNAVVRTELLLTFAEEAMQSSPAELEPLLKEAREQAPPSLAAHCDRILGWIDFDRASYGSSLEHFERARQVFQGLGDRSGLMKAINGMASVYGSQGRIDQALAGYREALDVATELGDRLQTQLIQANIGLTLMDLSQADEADTYLQAALEPGGLSALNEAIILHQVAKVRHHQNRTAEARETLERTIKLSRQGGFLSTLASSLALLGLIEAERSPGIEAENLLRESIAVAQQAGDRSSLAQALLDMGLLRQKQGLHKDAGDHFQKALTLAREIGSLLLEADALKGLSETWKATGDWEKALEAYEEFHRLSGRIRDEKANRLMAQMKADQSRRETDLYREQSRILAHLGEMGQKITATLDLESIVLAVYGSIGSLMKAETFGLGLFEEDRGVIDYRLFIEDGQRIPPFQASASAETLSGWCLRHRRDILVNDIYLEYGRYLSQLPPHFGDQDRNSRSCLYTPLLAEGQVLGVLSAQSYEPDAYSERDLATLKTLAASIAIAIQNARLFAQVNHLATVDTLTGASTRRHLFARAEEEFRRFLREQSQLALIMIDLDHFKTLNDTWGHATGDRVLADFGTLCLSHKRTHDLFGRYGGEEFSLVLVGTSLEGAVVSAERLCERVRKHGFLTSDGTPLQVTASFGVTVFSSDDKEITRVFSRADTALYEAKLGGRDRVMTRLLHPLA